MTPEQQTPASVVETELSNNPCQFGRDQPVSNHYKLAEASKAFLTEAARYFEARPTGGEDAAHWSNVFNAKNCREAADMIERLSAEREGLRDALEPIARRVVPDHYDDKTLIGWISAGEIRAARAALTQGESRQTEWVEWHGGGNPVGRDDVAEVKRRDGSVITKAAFKFDWGHGPIAHGSDIIAYRTPLPAAPTPAGGGWGMRVHSGVKNASIPTETEAAPTPVCRICRASKWVGVHWPDAPEKTICMECCGGDMLHADGETGHQWSLRGEGCDYCGISRRDGENPNDHEVYE